ncbi:MAG TPA: response regulator transcription factor [Anaerolineaceae bacterium]|nr:response regulator transcription factor [Anaerolineaceae bacterium]
MKPVRILVADDHRIVREGLRLILETEDDFELVGEAADGGEAVRQAAVLQPDVVLMDLRMPGIDGLEAIDILQREQPQIGVVILTTYNEDDMLLRGLQAGARGYLLKDTDRKTLFDTIRAAARGETLLKPEILARVLRPAHSAAERPAAAAVTMGPELTERELEVLNEVAGGARSKEIAHRLHITERTVKAHLASIYNKLGVDSRAAAIAVAAQRGYLRSPD